LKFWVSESKGISELCGILDICRGAVIILSLDSAATLVIILVS